MEEVARWRPFLLAIDDSGRVVVCNCALY